MNDHNELGEYLKARRELVLPDDVGILNSGLRRVAGLRREEVAMLAGISSDYYLRLEQGRDRNPSVQVLEALARVLLLDDAATAYLASLAQERPRRPARPRREVVPAGILQLVDVIDQPAFVEGRYFDVLASNSFALALSPSLAVGQNRLRSVFLDAEEQSLYGGQWERAAAALVAGFRTSVGTNTADPRCRELVGELSLESEAFRRLWARHDVKLREGAAVVIEHPEVGNLDLRRDKLLIEGTDGLMLVVYHAARGSETEAMLRLLRSMREPEQQPAPGRKPAVS